MRSKPKMVHDIEEVEPNITGISQGLVNSCGFRLDPEHLLLLPR